VSTRAVPLQATAFEALDRLPVSVNPILFPNGHSGRIDFRIFGRKHWRPAQIKVGIEPVRGLYDLRHTYATFALRAGVSVHGNGFRLSEPFSRPSHLPPTGTSCDRWAP
jgi:integrase